MFMTAKAMKSRLEILKPHLNDGTNQSKGIVVIDTVKDDFHDIGKNQVSMMRGRGSRWWTLGWMWKAIS
jgi:5-methyltetrahydrofolate--homocysteine methyltransferase